MALIIPFGGKSPVVADDAFVAPTAVLIGDVRVESGASVWFGVVLRGDVAAIHIGPRSNVQDNTVIHVDQDAPTVLEADVTIGHGAIVHGCTVGAGAQVGMGAIVLSHAVVGSGSMVAAGAVVPEGMHVPDGALAMGIPARVKRDVSADERESLVQRAQAYSQRGSLYRSIISELDSTRS